MRQGFTLIQLSIILTVAALVMVTLLPTYQTQLNNNKATANKLNAVLLAMREYQAANGALPCPADASQPIGSTNYGKAAANPDTANNCGGGFPAANYTDATDHVAVGMVPVRTLGLSFDNALDGFGRTITYAVDTNATACWGTAILPGKITVADNGAAVNSVVALVSHGQDGHGAWIPLPGSSGTAVRLNTGSTDADQLTNAHVDASFTPTTVLTNFVRKPPTATFDDLLVYKNPQWNMAKVPDAQILTPYPTVTPPGNGLYVTGQALTFTLTFNAVATVTGTPRLDLTIDGVTRFVTYVGGSGTTVLTFSYTVQASDATPPIISLTSPVDMNGGTIKVLSNNTCIVLFTPPDLSRVKINSVIYVADTGNNRVEIFSMNGAYIGQFGSYGSGNGQLYRPISIAIDANYNIWVADQGNQRIEEFDSNGNYLSQFPLSSLPIPNGIAIDANGNIWLTQYASNQVEEFSASGVLINQFSAGSSGAPVGIAIDANTNIWVTDFSSNNRVQEFSASGAYLTQFGSSGSGNGQFNGPWGVTIDASNHIFVSDKGNQRIEKFDATGAYLTQFGSSGSGNGQFAFPLYLTTDAFGNIWVADPSNNRIEEFSASGAYLTQFGSSGSGSGQFNAPGGIAIK